MKLLFIDFTLPYLLRDSEFPVGGWAVQLTAWLSGLSGLGHNCAVLTWKGANAYAGAQSTCELIETYDPSRGLKVLKYGYYYIPALFAAARAWRPDVLVQSTRSVETGIMAFIARQIGVPFIYRVASDADVDERYRIGLPSYGRLSFRRGFATADLVICQNGYQAEQARRKRPERALHVQANVFETIPDAEAPLPRSERGYMAWLGVFRRPKNLPLLLAVARSLPHIQFWIAGMPATESDPDTLFALEGLRRLPNVRFVGYLKRTEVAGFLARATALLCTSHYEGFSNTFLEAFAAGAPVVTRKGVDPDSVIANRALGRVAEDNAHYRDCVREIHDLGPAHFDDLAWRCRRYVATYHAPAPIMQSFVDAIRPLAAGRS